MVKLTAAFTVPPPPDPQKTPGPRLFDSRRLSG
jgi:hypothetical protein